MDDLLIIVGVWAICSMSVVEVANILGLEHKENVACQYVKQDGFNRVVYKTKCEVTG